MTNSASRDAKTIWQTQPMEGTTVTLDDIRNHAAKFQNRVRNRNLREYVACAFVIAVFGFYAWVLPSWMVKLGSVVTVAATIFVAWQLHRRGKVFAMPDSATAGGLLAFHRQQLMRQRDALRTVGLWYIAPFVPGLALLLLGRYLQAHAPGRALALDHTIIIFSGIIILLVLVIVWLLNLWGAARLQNRIYELDKLRAE